MLLLHRLPRLRQGNKEGKNDRGTPFRDCFFLCLSVRVPDNNDGKAFVDYVDDLYEWCEDKRGKKAPESEGKVLKCTLKKTKKDACDKCFPGDGYKPLYN